MSTPSRHEHGLLDLCGEIHGSVTGSGDGIPRQRAEELRDWQTGLGQAAQLGSSPCRSVAGPAASAGPDEIGLVETVAL